VNERSRIQNQDEWKRTQLRVPQDDYNKIVEYAELNKMSLNTAILNLIDIGLNTATAEVKTSGRSIYFQDMNCVEDYPKEPLHERTARVERMISEIFYRNPQYQLINIETLNDGKKIRYWYSIPRSESFRD
jgi:hypothetical protein